MQAFQKYFSALAIAARKVDERRRHRERLQGYLRKIKLVSAQTAKKSVISSELDKLEHHLAELITQKMYMYPHKTDEDRKKEEEISQKELELNMKIAKLNELLSQVGKKINENEFKEQLSEEVKENMKPSQIDELENKLYSLEAKYYEMIQNPNLPKDIIDKLKEKISNLKEKIREIKTR